MTNRESPYERALMAMRTLLRDKIVDSDESFPSEEALAARLRISRGTVRKVLRSLNDEGLIRVQRTRGRRVRQRGELYEGRAAQAVVVLGAGPEAQTNQEEHEGSVEDSCIRAFRDQGQPVLLIDAQHAMPEQALKVLGRTPLGVILTQYVAEKPQWRALMMDWKSSGVPVVAHGNDRSLVTFDRVYSDHCGGAYGLTRRLIDEGRRKIVPLWTLPEAWHIESANFVEGRPDWVGERERGYREAMTEAGIAPAPAINVPNMPDRCAIPDLANLELRSRACLGFLYHLLREENSVDALMAINDAAAFPVASACRMLGRRVHDQVAVTGFDAMWHTYWEWGATGLAPYLTARKHNHAVGRTLAELLMNRVSGKSTGEPVVRCLPIDVEKCTAGPALPNAEILSNSTAQNSEFLGRNKLNNRPTENVIVR